MPRCLATSVALSVVEFFSKFIHNELEVFTKRLQIDERTVEQRKYYLGCRVIADHHELNDHHVQNESGEIISSIDEATEKTQSFQYFPPHLALSIWLTRNEGYNKVSHSQWTSRRNSRWQSLRCWLR